MAGIRHSRQWMICSLIVFCGICWPMAVMSTPITTPITATWIDSAGDWTDGTKWSTNPDYPNNGTPAGTTYGAVVDFLSPSSYTVNISDVAVEVDSLLVDSANATVQLVALPGVSNPHFTALDGIEVADGTFCNNGGIIANTRIHGTGGRVLLDSGLLNNVVLDHDATTGRGQWINGLSLNGTLNLDHKYSSYTPKITFSGSQTLSGSGSIILNDPSSLAKVIQQDYDEQLVIDNGITIKTGAVGGGIVGNNGFTTLPGLVNRGMISAETAGATLTIGSNWINQGVMQIKNGSTLKLDGSYSSSSLGTINNIDGTLQFGGTLDNTAQNFSITPAMGTTQIVGTIKGGSFSIEPGANLLPGAGTFDGVTMLSDYTVAGRATLKGDFQNNAVVRVPGGNYLTIGGEYTKANLGDIRAAGGQVDLTGTWDLGSDSFDFNSTTGSWRLSSYGTISGGTLTAHDGQGLSIYQGTLDNVTLAMRPSVPYQQDCLISNGLTFLPGGGLDVASKNYLWFMNTQTLSGTGDISLTYRGSAIIRAGATLTIGPGVTIQGKYDSNFYCQSHVINEGTISGMPGPGKFIINANHNTIPLENRNLMDAPTDSILEVRIGPGFDNTGLMRSSGGELRLGGNFAPGQLGRVENQGGVVGISGAMDNVGSTLTLDATTGSWTLLGGGTISGGRICGTEGSKLLTSVRYELFANNVKGAYLTNGVVLDIDVSQKPSSSVNVSEGLTINRQWSIDGSSNTCLGFNGTQMLQGSGVISFANGNYASVVPLDGILTIGPDITIRSDTGGGTVGSSTSTGVSIVNQGLISAQTLGKTVTIAGNGPSFTNSGVLEARNGDTMLVNNVTTNLSGTQLTGGSWRVFANSTMRLVGADIQTNAAEIVLDGNDANVYNAATGTTSALSNFSANDVSGRFIIRNGRNFTTAGVLSNSGAISVGSDTTLNVAGALVNTSFGTVSGGGIISSTIFNAGTIAPGEDGLQTELLTILGNVTEQDGSRFQMELGGTVRGSTYDAVNLTGILHCNGVLDVSLVGGFDPALGMSFDLFDFAEVDGRFVTLDLPTLPDGLSWETGNLYTTGAIQVIPEPSFVTLLGMGVFSLFVCFRHWHRN